MSRTLLAMLAWSVLPVWAAQAGPSADASARPALAPLGAPAAVGAPPADASRVVPVPLASKPAAAPARTVQLDQGVAGSSREVHQGDYGGLPEPASWFLMLVGVGMIGGALRGFVVAHRAIERLQPGREEELSRSA